MSESLKEKVKTTEEIAELWNTYCKEGCTEVPQKIMELMEATWVRLEDAQKEIDHLDGLKQKLSELLKQYEDYPIFHSSLQELEKLLKEKKAKPCP